MRLGDGVHRLRTDLHLSQNYVTGFLGIKRSVVAKIELGRKGMVKVEESGNLDGLFLDPADYLVFCQQHLSKKSIGF